MISRLHLAQRLSTYRHASTDARFWILVGSVGTLLTTALHRHAPPIFSGMQFLLGTLIASVIWCFVIDFLFVYSRFRPLLEGATRNVRRLSAGGFILVVLCSCLCIEPLRGTVFQVFAAWSQSLGPLLSALFALFLLSLLSAGIVGLFQGSALAAVDQFLEAALLLSFYASGAGLLEVVLSHTLIRSARGVRFRFNFGLLTLPFSRRLLQRAARLLPQALRPQF